MILQNKHHICLCAAALAAGILAAGGMPHRPVVPAILIFAGCAATLCLHPARLERKIMTAVCIGMALLGASLTLRQCAAYDRQVQAVSQTDTLSVGGIVSQKEIKSDYYLYHIKKTYQIKKSQLIFLGNLIIYTQSDDIPIGAFVEVSGEPETFSHARNDGNFDFADYYRQMNITCRMYADEVSCVKAPKISIREMLYQVQKHLAEVYIRELNKRDAGILCTLAIGSRSQLDADIKQMYQEAGISHILAISGLHISVLGYSVFRFLRKIRFSYPAAVTISSTVVLLFALMSGFGVSARRAAIMYLCLMGAQLLGRTYDGAVGLSLAAILILLQNPLSIYQSGFLFSFTALLAIVLYNLLTKPDPGKNMQKEKTQNHKFASVRKQWIFICKTDGNSGKTKVGRGIMIWERFFVILEKGKKQLFFNAFLQFWMMPLTAWFYYEVPVYALFLNLLVIPLCGWLLGFGLLGAVAGLGMEWISKWIFVGCHWILNLYDAGIKVTQNLPGHTWRTGQPEMKFMILFYTILGLSCLVWYRQKELLSMVPSLRRKNSFDSRRSERPRVGSSSPFFSKKSSTVLRRFGESCAESSSQFFWEKNNVVSQGKKRCVHGSGKRFPIWISLAAFFLCMLAHTPEHMGVYVLDVGQGDGIFVTDGKGGTVFVDGGSSSENEVGKYRILPFLKYHRVSGIDVWIVTHTDTDHISGLLELLEDDFPIGQILLAAAIPEDENYAMLQKAAKEAEVEIKYISRGDVLQLSGAFMTCLYPEKSENETEKNALSQVWKFKSDAGSMLLTGDLGEAQEELLLKRGKIETVDVLKVAHHGSKYSTGNDLLDELTPKIAVISCSADNLYGHPAAETVTRLEEADIRILYTMESGQIFLDFEGENFTAD